MKDQDWKRALELYEAASDLPEPEAYALLNSLSDQPALVERVSKMLGATGESAGAVKTNTEDRFVNFLIGRYEATGLLGRGSTGEVYAGLDRELGRPVALKTMSSDFAKTNSAMKRFVREAQAASALNHPNIVTVHEVITWNSAPVIVMELVEGKPLRVLCGQPMPVAVAIRIGTQVMEALSCAHSNGIVHRDLKPENIMVRPDGYVRVLDFGLAHRTFLDPVSGSESEASSSTAGLPVGTLRYMSPEQCRGETATPASDVFAVGMILYEILAGRHPFYADSPLDTAHAIVWKRPPSLSRANPAVPEVLENLIFQMLAKRAESRPASQDVAKALKEIGDRSSSVTVWPRLAQAACAAGLAALVIAAGAIWFIRPSVSRRPAERALSSEVAITPIAGLLGVERFPNLSRDGTRVAFEFSSESSPISHVYIKDLSTSQLTRVTDGDLPDYQPVFSPDGKMLAFFRIEDGVPKVMLLPSTGGTPRKVGQVSGVSFGLRIMTWDSRGEDLIVSDGLGKPEVQIALFSLSLRTGVKRQLTFPNPRQIDCMPSVSPDGRSLGFARTTEHATGFIWAIPMVGGLPVADENQRRLLTASIEGIFDWNWSNDGRGLLMCRRKGAKAYLWWFPIGEGAPVRVAGIDDEVAQISLSPVGSRLIYAGPTIQNTSIWRYALPPATEPPKRLIASARLDMDPRYSPDGKNIAFASMRSASGQINLWICASDGSNQRQVASFPDPNAYAIGSPSWSPDGRWIAFDGGLTGTKSGIYLLDVLGGKHKRLTPSETEDSLPSWSHDGRSIFYSSHIGGRQNIWKISISGGAPVQVTRDGGFESYASVDGQALYFTKVDRPGIWRIPLPEGEEELVPGLEKMRGRDWEGSSKGIYFVAPSRPLALEFFDFSSHRLTRVRQIPVPSPDVYRGLSVAPDERSIIYLQSEAGRSNVMVANNFR